MQASKGELFTPSLRTRELALKGDLFDLWVRARGTFILRLEGKRLAEFQESGTIVPKVIIKEGQQ